MTARPDARAALPLMTESRRGSVSGSLAATRNGAATFVQIAEPDAAWGFGNSAPRDPTPLVVRCRLPRLALSSPHGSGVWVSRLRQFIDPLATWVARARFHMGGRDRDCVSHGVVESSTRLESEA
jgi:hypothetical protein